ncbi:precorrin-4 C(11)-methyltransferase [Desulfuromonas versatilis]|uniref:Precorrin-4 C(11)-methyltransferase n=1 Tax=Desulfuromonas versatilis TaxID=2802975 RepID=A0ABM8HVI8_9BACT|nr:SAM-dependent methyltransferase [Desulfuromonas versatilis]BCR04736.1 precorrin-4 C(11)-methyltransferase [Desulfuromonas versatilis]
MIKFKTEENQVFFIGAGPGDPDLLTLKGARALEGCHAVFAPTPYEETFAQLLRGKQVLVPFGFYFQELLDLLHKLLEKGDVAFLVPGDLTFYSPFQALIDVLGTRAEVIAGVGTANAASAFLKKTLDLPGVCNRAVIASPRTLGDQPGSPTLAELAAPGVTLLIYMNNLPLPELVAQLKKGYGKSVPIALVHRLCLPGEEVVLATLDEIVEQVGERDFFNLTGTDRRPALTLVVAGETLSATVDGSWWDFRRDTIWKFREE